MGADGGRWETVVAGKGKGGHHFSYLILNMDLFEHLPVVGPETTEMSAKFEHPSHGAMMTHLMGVWLYLTT